ncbi:MAG: proline dehydrogenase family protein [Bacteroidota bacterium]
MPVTFDDTRIAYAHKSNSELRNANFIFSVIDSPLLCMVATTAVKWCLKLRVPIEGIIRRTVYAHFCGGNTIQGVGQVIGKLSSSAVKTILDYSVEGADKDEDFDLTANEILLTIQNAAHKNDIAFAVFKITGVASASLLEKVQQQQILTPEENLSVQKFRERIDTICKTAYENNIRLLIDAEESWIQGAIDSIVNEMMARYNKGKPIVFNTYQLYRTDALATMIQAFQNARKGGYFFGVKLVRGAYMEKERGRARRLRYHSPIHADRDSTDIAFNAAIEYCIQNLQYISVMCGSHNEYSNRYMVALMCDKRIKNNDPRVWFSQLYGMSDNISFSLARSGYNVAKYLPYGPIKAVIPYLLRRASENTSVAGQSSRELTLIRKEIRRRKTDVI